MARYFERDTNPYELWFAAESARYQQLSEAAQNASMSLVRQTGSCDAAQMNFELSFCSWASQAATVATMYSSCRSGALAQLTEAVANVTVEVGGMKAQARSAQRVLCYFGVLSADPHLQPERLEACRSLVVDASFLNITAPAAAPSVSTLPNGTSADLSPGQQEWKEREYASMPADAPAGPVRACAAPTSTTTTTTTKAAMAKISDVSLAWEKDFGILEIRHLTPDAMGGFFALGWHYYGSLGPHTPGAIARFAGNGTLLSKLTYNQSFIPIAILADGAGGVFASARLPGDELADLRMDAQGRPLWRREAPVPGFEERGGLVGDGSGGYFRAAAGSHRTHLRRYDPRGSMQWDKPGLDGSFRGMVSDGSGGVYLCRGGIFERRDGAGNVLWTMPQVPGFNCRHATMDGFGGVIVGGTDSSDGLMLVYLTAANGTVKITSQIPNTRSFNSIMADGSGGAIVGTRSFKDATGKDYVYYAMSLLRVDAAGKELWRKDFDIGTYEWASCLYPDGAGGFYAAGTPNWSGGGPTPGKVWKFESS